MKAGDMSSLIESGDGSSDLFSAPSKGWRSRDREKMKWAPAIGSKAAIPQSKVPPFTGFLVSRAAGGCINQTCND